MSTRTLAPSRAAFGPSVTIAATSDRLATITLWLLAALYPLHSSAIGVNLSVGDGIIGLALVGLAYRFATDAVVFPRYTLHALAVLSTIVVSITLNALAPHVYFPASDAVVEAVKFVAVAAWMIVIFGMLYPDFARRYLHFATVSVLVAVAWSLWTVYDNLVVGVQRPSGPFENPNIYANYLVFNAFLALGANTLLAEDETGSLMPWLRRHRLLLLSVVSAILMLGLLSTGSRGGLLAFAVGNVAAIRCWLPKRVTPKVAIGAVLGVIVCAAAVYWFLQNHPYILIRMARTGAQDHNVTERLDLWGAARDAFYQQPLFGIGYGQFRYYADYTHGLVPKVTHQTYLSAAAELGLLGVAACAWLVGAILKDSWFISFARGGRASAALFGFLVAVCVQATLANVDQFRTVWIAFGMIAALAMAAERSRMHQAAPRPGGLARSHPGRPRRTNH